MQFPLNALLERDGHLTGQTDGAAHEKVDPTMRRRASAARPKRRASVIGWTPVNSTVLLGTRVMIGLELTYAGKSTGRCRGSPWRCGS
jgi:hypothetical protein